MKKVELTNGVAQIYEDHIFFVWNEKYGHKIDFTIDEVEIKKSIWKFDGKQYVHDIELNPRLGTKIWPRNDSPWHYRDYESTGKFKKIINFDMKKGFSKENTKRLAAAILEEIYV